MGHKSSHVTSQKAADFFADIKELRSLSDVMKNSVSKLRGKLGKECCELEKKKKKTKTEKDNWDYKNQQ